MANVKNLSGSKLLELEPVSFADHDGTKSLILQSSDAFQTLLQQNFANLPFEKSISDYPQNLWITLLMDSVDATLKWRRIRVYVTLPIFYKRFLYKKYNELA